MAAHQQDQKGNEGSEGSLVQLPDELQAATVSANCLLISSLEAGDHPITDDAELDAQIDAYRSCINKLSSLFRQGAAGDPPDAAHPNSSPSGRDQARPPAAMQHDQSGTVAVPGLGREGIDYTVGTADDLDPSEWQVPPHCIPIHANVTMFDWTKLGSMVTFDVVMMDPPWQLATANPTRGVALGYSQLTDNDIRNLPIPQLQRTGGYLFVWVINSKYQFTLDLFDAWGYRLVDEIVWVKMTVNRRLFKSHGYYLQHAKEVCMVARKKPSQQEHQHQQQQQQECRQDDLLRAKGLLQAGLGGVGSDVIFSERRGQSQKPEEIYHLIEELVPDGKYLEIFARKNNLRNFWVSVGNEVTGTGLPEDDVQVLQQTGAIPGAVYGRGSGGDQAAPGPRVSPADVAAVS